MTLQVVVDTNLVVSAFLWGGSPETLISALLTRGIPMLTTSAMIDELDATLRKPKFDSRFRAKGITPEELMEGYRQMTQVVSPAKIPGESVRDPKDRIILAAAVGGSATHLISGDKDLTTLQQYHEVTILTVAQFLAMLTLPTESLSDEPEAE